MTLPARRFPKPPAEVATYAEILGIGLAIEFLLRFGGAEIYLAVSPKTRGRVAQLVGVEKARALAANDHRLPRRVPLATPWLTACLHAQGWPVAEIARRPRITDVTVRRHLNRYRRNEAAR